MVSCVVEDIREICVREATVGAALDTAKVTFAWVGINKEVGVSLALPKFPESGEPVCQRQAASRLAFEGLLDDVSGPLFVVPVLAKWVNRALTTR
jgi:hypothetical protein